MWKRPQIKKNLKKKIQIWSSNRKKNPNYWIPSKFNCIALPLDVFAHYAAPVFQHLLLQQTLSYNFEGAVAWKCQRDSHSFYTTFQNKAKSPQDHEYSTKLCIQKNNPLPDHTIILHRPWGNITGGCFLDHQLICEPSAWSFRKLVIL